MHSRVLYLAAGNKQALHTQALYAALSALAWGHPRQEVLLFTDSPEHYAMLAPRMQVEPLPQELTAPDGGNFDPFHMKLQLLGLAARRFRDDAVLFCDADTFFVRGYGDLLQRVKQGVCVMHRKEYSVAQHPTPQMRKFRAALTAAELPPTLQALDMWNSGVVGLPPYRSAAIAYAQELFATLGVHTRKRYLAEQFSLSAALAENGTPQAAEDWVFHYWYQKADYTQAIEEFFSSRATLPLEELLDCIRGRRIVLQPPPQKLHWWEHALIAAGKRQAPEDIRGLPPATDTQAKE